MSIDQYLEENKKIQKDLLDYLNGDTNAEENYANLKNAFKEIKIRSNQYEIKSLLYLILKISNNHQRKNDFFSKIQQVLLLLKDDMKNYFPNSELFRIFKSNKRLLLILLEENIMIMDEDIVKQIVHNDKYIIMEYPQYFIPEILPYINEEWFPKVSKGLYFIGNEWVSEWVNEIKQEIPEDYYEKRKIGENDNHICKLIREDLVEEFIIYVNRNSYSLKNTINRSIYETNSFFLKNNETTLIEYAAFYGSIQIFNYLKLNNVEVGESLWIYAMHGQNAEIIHFLEDNKILPKDKSYDECLTESIKCHHIDIINYIQNNYNIKSKDYDALKYYNFDLIKNEIINQSTFCILCKFDYYLIVNFLLENANIDVNIKFIHNISETGRPNFKEEKTALFLAIEKNNIEIVKLLLKNSEIDVNVLNKLNNKKYSNCFFEKTALCLAVQKNNIKIAKLLLENSKIDVNAMNKKWYGIGKYPYNEKTVLYYAIKNKNKEFVELLLNHIKIDVNILNIKNDYGNDRWQRWERTALHLAIKDENIEIVKLLLTKKNINVNILNKHEEESFDNYGEYKEEKWKGDANKSYNEYGYEKTPLYKAIERGNIEIVKLLLKNENIDVNISNRIKWHESGTDNCNQYEKTALFLAIEKENIEIIELLLSNNKIDVNITNQWWNYNCNIYDENNYNDYEESRNIFCEYKKFYEYIKPKWKFEILNHIFFK